jgi:hypothetical protein
MTTNRARITAVFLAILAAAALRLVPHPPNFTPIGAMALFAGAYLGRNALAFAGPLGALLLSDLVLGFYSGAGFVYAATAGAVLVGWAIERRRTAANVVLAAIGSASLFFLVTNLGMWLFSGFYPVTVAGLAACFAAAIPFFQNSLAGDLIWSAILFGGFALAERGLPALRERGSAQA